MFRNPSRYRSTKFTHTQGFPVVPSKVSSAADHQRSPRPLHIVALPTHRTGPRQGKTSYAKLRISVSACAGTQATEHLSRGLLPGLGLVGSLSGGGGGIRTHGDLTTTPVFKTGAFNRSATPPIR